MTIAKGARLELIGESAVHLLAERGMRGLTHRAVDEAAGLPLGSTSYYARTRAALLNVALARMTSMEAGEFAEAAAAGATGDEPPGLAALLPTDVDGVVDLLTGFVRDAIRDGRDQKIARYELALEATRRADLREAYDEAGRVFREAAVALVAALGARDPVRQGRVLVAWCEGVMFDSIAGAGWSTPPSREEISMGLRELLGGMLASP
ncbi:TetR/AcrR family transcriptional regulator [Yinghuangia sp. ASG 101]|uniref:TetR/AcrR family transcriptional regulator n=1 Tax=Yinghuangia sp. ASG 101 TaxID=2896848 RepID=UPI001E4C6960|nr:TetR/AcrR family transcriptional regulator [Yinghuangia sp. ASG 101]UGQ09006.1 TetR/AcrR family transcriptional regulator [Yinghuangia sp. ASG 101]